MSKKISTPGPHGIDLYAPGGIEQLLDFHRATFGDATMLADGDDGEQAAGDGKDGGSDGAEGTDDPDRGLKSAIQAEREAAKKAKADLAVAQKRIQELEDAGKTEEQKREQAAERLQTEHASLKRESEQKDALLQRYEVAAAKGLSLSAAARLQGATREEIEADADAWIAEWGPGKGPGVPQQRQGDPGQGARHGAQESTYAQGADRAKARFGDQKQQ